MSDNVGYTEGSGRTVGADDVGGVLYQRVKVVLGDDGAIDGDVSAANPVPVTVTGSSTVNEYALVNDTPSVYVPGDMQPLSMTTEGRLRVSAADPRFAEAPFDDALRGVWGDLNDAWGAREKHNSPWSSW